MGKVQTYLMLLLILLSVTCKKEYSSEGSKLPENSWEFSESTEQSGGPVDSAFIFPYINVESLVIYGTSGNGDADNFYLRINTINIQTGIYSGKDVQFQYSAFGNADHHSGFTVVIEHIDDNTVSGTFSGTIKDSLNEDHTITDGKFHCSFRQITNQPHTLTVWAKELCGMNNKIEIRVQGSSQFITSAHAEQPLCGAAGTASFSLKGGDYSIEAICGNDTLIYQARVTDKCSYLEIELNEDYLPLGKTSYWEYADVHDQSVSQVFTAESDAVFNGNTYTKVSSTRGTDYYFRKLPHTYYQYRELSFQDFVSNPPVVELIILKDNLPKGGRWETDPLDVSISGVVRKIKLVSRIMDRDYSEIINGVEYQHLIRVNTELFFSPDDGYSYATSGSAYNTVFARGKGIVSYNDMDVAIEWGVKNIFLSP